MNREKREIRAQQAQQVRKVQKETPETQDLKAPLVIQARKALPEQPLLSTA